MSVDFGNTYWEHKGKYEDKGEELDKLIPAQGKVANPALETYRKARNCYHDLYNNGLGNRGQEFVEVFGFDAFDVGELSDRPCDIDEPYSGSVDLTQELIDRTETRMDEIILAAYAEQFPVKKLAGTIDLTPVGCQTPEGTARVNQAVRTLEDETAHVANLATTFIEQWAPAILTRSMSMETESMRQDIRDLRKAIESRNIMQEKFLRAVAGVSEGGK